MTQFAKYPGLKGTSVIVTGGASGIGAAIVEAFAAEGARVGFVDFDEASAAKLLERLDGDIAFEPCDLRDIDQLQSSFAKLAERIGTPTVLVNNAARDDRHDWTEVTPDFWDERMNTNLRHQFFAIQAVAPGMIKAGKGSIINMGSVSWMMPQGGMPAYTTGKSAVHGLTRGIAQDLGKHRIRVNTVVPGWILTERQRELWLTPEAEKKHLERQILPDLIEPVYLARMVLFLASDDAAMCTAQDFYVEAGTV
ncbi:SDR family NAD(P)-dependent oxidoreductase [Primorskyibacter sp. 2E233]|uniref:SDR family NAD(P)-dependent oxidoreductase n=1 Tax=Primorskyibacter sp. 2E233 TaxID=3413431 RepID=UPI003BF1AF9B